MPANVLQTIGLLNAVVCKDFLSDQWLDDFASCDRGKLFVRHDLTLMFESLGWRTLEDILRSDRLVLQAQHPDRDNCSLVVRGTDGTPDRRFYVKRHKCGTRAHNPAFQEAAAASYCRQVGVPAMKVAAVGVSQDRGDGWQSFFMSEEAGTGQSASKRVKQILASDSGNQHEEMVAVMRAVAQTASRLHSEGLFHGDCHWSHFILDADSEGNLFATLIDLQGAQRRQGMGAYYAWFKDLAQLRGSMRSLKLTDKQVDDWYEMYFCGGSPVGIGLSQNAIRAIVEARAGLRFVRGEWRTLRRRLHERWLKLIRRYLPSHG